MIIPPPPSEIFKTVQGTSPLRAFKVPVEMHSRRSERRLSAPSGPEGDIEIEVSD